MPKLVVMTDLHLTAGGKTIIGIDPLERLQKGLAHASNLHADADRLILTGDLAHHGEPAAYEALRDALGGVPWPVSLMIGNHDNRANFLNAFPDCPTDPAGFVQSVVDIEDTRLIMLDTLEESAGHAGRLCNKRLNWLSDKLEEAGGRCCLVFLHHPPFATGFTGMDDIRLQNDTEVLNALSSGHVAHIFAGHVHRTISATINGLPFTIFKSTCHQMPMLLGKDGSDHSIDEPGAYGIVLANGKDVVVHFEDFTLPEQSVQTY